MAGRAREQIAMGHGTVSLGIDIGGTFTDVIASSPDETRILKVPSTRSEPSAAVMTALRELEAVHGIRPADIARFAHGTTVATNAVIERRGARIGIVTTEGFRDVLELGRQIRHQLYDLVLKPETPGWLAPGARRVEVRERIAADGSVVTPLDPASVDAAIDRLLAEGVAAVAVCLLFSFRNTAHEQAVREAFRRRAPHVAVSLSSDVDPAFREYERTVVTAFDAYIKPVVDRYLGAMSEHLSAAGVPAPLQVMQSRGGLAGAETARRRPVRLFLSGPAAGALGGAAVGRDAGLRDLITIDVGGTSSDIALIAGGEALVRAETDIAGYQVRVPMLDVTTLGAGGGSIAWIDAGGGLRVGPGSAGSEPGPACYGRGGETATVTDASVVLGYLDPGYFAGGRLKLDAALARRAIEQTVARPLGMSIEAAALGIHRIANAHMADGIRLVSVNRGYDPREFTLVALGGAGAVHAVALAAELEIGRVLVPRFPGVLSAGGLLAAPVEHEVSAAFHVPIATASLADIRQVLARLDAEAAELMAAERIDGLPLERAYAADVGYAGQSHFIEVPFEPEAPDPLPRLYAAFEDAHERINGLKTGAPAKIVNLRTVHRARLPSVALGGEPGREPGRSLKQHRPALLPGDGAHRDTPIHDRARLAAGETIDGSAIIEQDDTTTLVPAGWRARVIAAAALLIERKDLR
jgi:N-methylhydantoinase A